MGSLPRNVVDLDYGFLNGLGPSNIIGFQNKYSEERPVMAYNRCSNCNLCNTCDPTC